MGYSILDGNLGRLCREVDAMPYLFPPFEGWVDPKNVSRFMIKEITDGPFKGCYKPSRRGIEGILTNVVYIGWWIPLDGGCIENNHEAIVDDGLFTYAHKRISTYNLQGERQKPERSSQWGSTQALLKDEKGRAIYVSAEKGGTYRGTYDGGLVHKYNFSILVRTLDPIFLERFLERIKTIDPARFSDWEDRVEQQQTEKLYREKTIKTLIAEARTQWDEAMGVLKNPKIAKTEQMQIDLAETCAGLEARIAKLQKDLEPSKEEEADDEETLFEIYTILPVILNAWGTLSIEQRMRFVGALVRRVVLSHPAPSWLHIAIEWKFPEWGTDTRYIKRTTSNGSGWTQEEDQRLRELYPQAPVYQLLEAFPERTLMALRRRAEALTIERCAANEITTRSIYAHYCLKDIEFLEEKEKEAERGG